MIDQLDDIEARVSAALDATADLDELEEWRRATIGRKGEVQLLTRRMGEIEPADRPAFGKRINEIKTSLQAAFEARQEALKQSAHTAADAADSLDVTLP
ncbi:MAG: phenylalanine--tRNA ligase subunit alpha, partial [Holophagales bacterium]|nr:phenylalanine--tRNA ligase subunit alpha [Holophagales bacterium]